MGRAGPRRVKAYSREFKLKAVQLSGQPGVLIRDVAESLCIHPFMLSRWRKQVHVAFGWEVIVNGSIIPFWASVIACVAAATLAFMLWRETHSGS